MNASNHNAQPTPAPEPKTLWGLLIEFDSPEALKRAAERVRDAGFTRWDAYTPFPMHGLDRAMGVRPTILPWITLGGALIGAFGGLLMQWWMNAVDYPYLISGKPFFSLPILNGLPMLYHAVFTSRRFRRATTDGFYIAIEARDPTFDLERTREFAASLGGVAVEPLEE
ncbi:MAG: DUF3341 domain-containing protein [Candidatus Sumerlaeota bacterium]|nr:DUF3341 domain-containing protein [Candidatus Sumerlaeota bacterium]